MNMRDIETIKVRLGTAEDLVDALAVAWDTFAFVQAIADGYADQAPGLFAAFILAAGAATSGRDMLGFAPSMPSSPGVPPVPVGSDAAGAHDLADELAALASALGARLQTAASQACDPEDRQACERAAREAGHIDDLFSPGR